MRHLLAVAVATGVILAAGCTPAERAGVREDVRGMRQQVEGATEGVRQSAADAALAGKVKTAFDLRKGLDPEHIKVEASAGNVTLKGDVATREQAELAERVALEIEGVTAVDNQLMLRVPAKDGLSGTAAPNGVPAEPVTAPLAPGRGF